MFSEDESPHHRPHFHAYYQDRSASYALDPIELLEGSLPTPQKRLVEAWAVLHEEELLSDWKLLEAGKPASKIDPLKK